MNSARLGRSESGCLASQVPYPLLAISATRPGGLILCSGPYAEFAGPGAVVYSPAEPVYSLSVVLGDVELVPLLEPADCRRAYQRRLQWVNWLHQWVRAPQAEDRVEGVLAGLESLFDASTAIAIPTPVLARLAGALPRTVQQVRSHRTILDPAKPSAAEIQEVAHRDAPLGWPRHGAMLPDDLARRSPSRCFPAEPSDPSPHLTGRSSTNRVVGRSGHWDPPALRSDRPSHAEAMRIRSSRLRVPVTPLSPSRADPLHCFESWFQHVKLWEQPA